MSWTYLAVTGSQAIDAERAILSVVNEKLSNAQRLTCKIEASDQKGGDARAVVFYDNNGTAFDGAITGQFKMQYFKTGTDYDGMYQAVSDWLTTNLTMQQAQNARIVYTNAQEHDATIVVYYFE